MSINKPLTTARMPSAKMTRIHWHWTGGPQPTNKSDPSHYHFVYEADGRRIAGVSIKLNEKCTKGSGYAAHTLNANTGAIGLSVAGMGDAIESPFKAGTWPLTEAQVMAMIEDTAVLCQRYDIPVSPRTTLSHAEVQGTLGIAQRGKWDIARLPFRPDLVGAKAVGDWMRRETAALLPATPTFDPSYKPEKWVVVGVEPGRLNFRRSPGGDIIGSLPEGSIVSVNTTVPPVDEWWSVRSKAGYEGWVHSDYLKPA